MLRIAAIAVVAALVAMPATALAARQPQQNPFLPQQQQPAQEPVPAAPPPPPPAPVETGPTPLSRGSLALIALGLGVLIGGIWIFIARDARRATAGRVRVRSRGEEPFAVPQGPSPTRAAPRSRKVSAAERKRRKRGRAR